MASTAAKMFDMNPFSIRMWQLRKRHQERNYYGKLNGHGGNNIILIEAQEQAVFQFCQDQLVFRLGASTLLISYPANVFHLVLGRVIVMGQFLHQKYNIQKHQQSNPEYTESHQMLYLECA